MRNSVETLGGVERLYTMSGLDEGSVIPFSVRNVADISSAFETATYHAAPSAEVSAPLFGIGSP